MFPGLNTPEINVLSTIKFGSLYINIYFLSKKKKCLFIPVVFIFRLMHIIGLLVRSLKYFNKILQQPSTAWFRLHILTSRPEAVMAYIHNFSEVFKNNEYTFRRSNFAIYSFAVSMRVNF